MKTEQDLINEHGVKVGQIWRRNTQVPLARFEFEVVYVTIAFCVFHATERSVGSIPGNDCYGVESRYSQPYTENIERVKRDFVLIRESNKFFVEKFEFLEKQKFKLLQ